MKIIKTVFSGFIVPLGFLFLMVSLRDFALSLESTFLGGLVLGIPLTAASGYLLWSWRHRTQQELSDRLDAVFYYLLKANQGSITVIQLAMAANIPGTQAKEYLEQKSQEFNATFEHSDQGNIIYLFPV